jgi:hypothetical protein
VAICGGFEFANGEAEGGADLREGSCRGLCVREDIVVVELAETMVQIAHTLGFAA